MEFKGSLKIIVLRLLHKEDLTGSEIINQINEKTGFWKPSPGSIYPLMNELNEKKLVELKQDKNQKIYSITPEGKKILEKLRAEREKVIETIINDLKNAWNGVNKNELVICVGLNEKQIAWCESASWMDNTTIHAKIRQDVFDLKNYDGIKIADIADGNVKKLWQRKHFRDFEYLSVQVSNWVYISGIISTFIINIVAFIFCYKQV